MPVQIRRASEQDARALAALAEQTFRVAFARDNSPANMQRHCEETYGEALQRAEIRDPHWETWVAEDAGTLVAYAQLRLDSRPVAKVGERPIEILRFYVSASRHGTGLAHDLMRHLIARADELGADVIWLGVWEQNARAIAFYRKWGFDSVGDQIYRVGDDPQRDLVMRREIKVAR